MLVDDVREFVELLKDSDVEMLAEDVRELEALLVEKSEVVGDGNDWELVEVTEEPGPLVGAVGDPRVWEVDATSVDIDTD